MTKLKKEKIEFHHSRKILRKISEKNMKLQYYCRVGISSDKIPFSTAKIYGNTATRDSVQGKGAEVFLLHHCPQGNYD